MIIPTTGRGRIVIAAILWLLYPVVTVLAGGEGVAELASRELVELVEKGIEHLSSPVIAVVPFFREDGSKSMEGQLICERLVTEISVMPGVRVVERKHLEAVLSEQKLAFDGLISPETAVRAGRLTGATALLAGAITEMGDRIEIHARLFSVETSEIIASRKVTARRSIKSFISPLWDDIDGIKKMGSRFKARMWTENDRIKIGNEAVVYFEVEDTCYVTIFDYSTDGSITILFPNRFQPVNKVKGGRVHAIPSKEAGYRIRARGPAGIERLKLFATTEDLPLYVRDYSHSPFNTINDGDQFALRGLQATFAEMPDADWAECSHEFLIKNVYR